MSSSLFFQGFPLFPELCFPKTRPRKVVLALSALFSSLLGRRGPLAVLTVLAQLLGTTSIQVGPWAHLEKKARKADKLPYIHIYIFYSCNRMNHYSVWRIYFYPLVVSVNPRSVIPSFFFIHHAIVCSILVVFRF